MAFDEDTRRTIEGKARLFEATKERVITRIVDNIGTAKKKLEEAEKELLDEVEFEFGSNPFASFLSGVDSGIVPTDDKVMRILSREIPKSFGPSEEAFRSLLKEIESFKAWQEKSTQSPLDMVPKNVKCADITWDTATITWDECYCNDNCFYEIEVKSLSSVKSVYNSPKTEYSLNGLKSKTEYYVRVRVVMSRSNKSTWSNPINIRTRPKLLDDGWKVCPCYVNENKKYCVDSTNNMIAASTGGWCTIIGETSLPLNIIASWSIKLLESKNNDGNGIYIGVAPSDINQNDINYNKCGWYFGCYSSTLCSGPPHNYKDKVYGPRKEKWQYVRTGDSVGVVMDTTKGELSFVLDGVGLGIAYDGIHLDKPLVPCVLLGNKDDSVELDTSGIYENVGSSIPVPSNITIKSTTCDAITLTWDKVSGASFYQIEVDGSKSWDATTINTFTKRGFLPETEHSFRVRTTRGSSVSEWGDVVKGKSQKESFETSWWKEFPGDVGDYKYTLDEKNPRIASKINNSCWCTVIGNTSIHLNTITSWSIKVLKSKNNNGNGIYVGVAPYDINQNDDNYKKCGWYFGCYYSALYSGPPHKYSDKKYGLRKKKDGQYVHTGDSIGVVMDTTRGDLSFVLNNVNLGVAYKGILLDKPLAPCVLLYYQGDSVELDTSEVKENVDSSVPVPSNIITKSTTWDTITLAWDEVSYASFYQIEVDGNKSWSTSTTNTFTKRGLFPDTEYDFKVRTVKGGSVSEWSDVVKGKPTEKTFRASWWKKCPDDVDKKRKYRIEGKLLRIATKIEDGYCCTVIGNTAISFNKVTSWNIKILRSRDNGGWSIYIGIAPNDINQNNINFNYDKCGWYFYCYYSSLYSGPPHNYRDKEYGSRQGWGKYVHTGDSVGVVVDTTKGDLSFALNGVNLGVAYEGIPLDKPLVPCVLLGNKDDSIELVI